MRTTYVSMCMRVRMKHFLCLLVFFSSALMLSLWLSKKFLLYVATNNFKYIYISSSILLNENSYVSLYVGFLKWIYVYRFYIEIYMGSCGWYLLEMVRKTALRKIPCHRNLIVFNSNCFQPLFMAYLSVEKENISTVPEFETTIII